MVNNNDDNEIVANDENECMMTRKYHVYSFDKALRTTVNKNNKKDD